MKTLFHCLFLSVFIAAGCNSSESGPTAPPAPKPSGVVSTASVTPTMPPGHPKFPSISGVSTGLPPGHPSIDMGAQQLPPGTAATDGNPQWTVPADWKPGPATMVRRASFVVSGAEGQGAEIAVTVFSGDVGGLPNNVNRWRAQLGLPPVAPKQFGNTVTTAKFNGTDVNIVDFATDAAPAGKTQPQRMVVVVYPHEGNSWFFKMTGDGPVVAVQKDALLKFIQSVKF